MKFWKLSLITTLCFSAFITILLFTACERNACDNVTCFNGGSCNVGTCHCPTGWEDPQCQTKSTARYIGNYAGYITCNTGTGATSAPTFDTAAVFADNSGILNVVVALRNITPKVLRGYVSNNESTYSIIVTNNDSTVTLTHYYSRYFTVTLQGDNTLSINYFEKNLSPTDTSISHCTFTGTKY